MMPQPIDVHTELARTTAAQRVQEIADRASLAAQQRQAKHAHDEQVKAESVVHQAAESTGEPVVADRREGRERKLRRPGKRAQNGADAPHADHGAGDLEVLPDSERHRLDVNA